MPASADSWACSNRAGALSRPRTVTRVAKGSRDGDLRKFFMVDIELGLHRYKRIIKDTKANRKTRFVYLQGISKHHTPLLIVL
jgi:hypothetical protein